MLSSEQNPLFRRGLADKGGVKINKEDIRNLQEQIKKNKLPRHVAIIMDGNGRWAQKKGLSRDKGHRQGVETLKKTVRACGELGITILTVFAFSTENWTRPPQEVQFLMELFYRTFKKEARELIANRVRVVFIGDRSELSPKLKEIMARIEEDTGEGDGLQLNIALNYGSRQEIMEAVRSMLETGERDFSLEQFSQNLYTGCRQDVDLLIRPGGEMRLSNFLLWQSAYAELYFTPVLWPDFSEADLYRAVLDFQNRQRRFGRVGGD